MRRKSILIVDDSTLVLDILSDAFAGAGYAVRLARGAEEALALLEGEPPELILSDILMPGMDGWAFFEEVRRRPGLDGAAFLFLTQEKELPKKVRGLRMGAHDYITKPFSVEEILARAELILERKWGREKAVPGAPPHLSGHTSQLSIADLLQILSMNGRTGVLRLTSSSPGEVHLREGRVVNAFHGRVSGRKALYRLLGWDDALFRFEPTESSSVLEEIAGSTSETLVQGLVDLDELSRLHDRLPGPETVLTMRPAAADSSRNGLSPVEHAVLSRAREPVTLPELLDDVAAPDAEVSRAVEEMLTRGLLEAL